VPFGVAKLVIDFVMVDDIIAMSASGRRLQVRRAIEMTDAEIREVIRKRCGIGKSEIGMKLNSIGGSQITRHIEASSDVID
jgi:hypothetical protein